LQDFTYGGVIKVIWFHGGGGVGGGGGSDGRNIGPHYLHSVVYHDWWHFVVNTAMKIKIYQSCCSNWFYLIVATGFCLHMGPSSGSLINTSPVIQLC
jgi:hypothetical protein